MKKVAGLMAAVAVVALGGGAYWVDIAGKKHSGNMFQWHKAKSYGVDYGMVKGMGYVKIKVRSTVRNRCYFLAKGKGGWRRNEWRKVNYNTVELDFGDSGFYGASLMIDHNSSNKKTAWDVFGMGWGCSEVPQYEKWVIYEKSGRGWNIIGRQDFVIEP